MSGGEIFTLKNLQFGALLILQVIKVDVQTAELGRDLLEHPPQAVIQNYEQQAPAFEALQDTRGSVPESRDEAPQPQGDGGPRPDPVQEVLDGIDELTERATKTKEDKEDPSPEAKRELLEAQLGELKALEATQGKERAGQTAQLNAQENQLKKDYAGPELQQHLDDLQKVATALDKEMGDRHKAQIRHLDERWEQKFQQLQDQPQIVPLPPNRDGR